jgi:hypothetical protein
MSDEIESLSCSIFLLFIATFPFENSYFLILLSPLFLLDVFALVIFYDLIPLKTLEIEEREGLERTLEDLL